MRGTPGAFARLDVLATLAAIAIIALISTPLLAGRGDRDRLVCANNLRLIGRAIQSFATDHEQRTPWLVPLQFGGTYYTPKAANAWFEFTRFSNDTASAKIYVCPADMAADRSVVPAETYQELQMFRQNAVSYSINTHAGRTLENEWMLSDHNMRFDNETPCALSGINNTRGINAVSNMSVLAWTNYAHGEAGNMLWFDGRVEFTSTPRLREVVLKNSVEGFASAHIIKAR